MHCLSCPSCFSQFPLAEDQAEYARELREFLAALFSHAARGNDHAALLMLLGFGFAADVGHLEALGMRGDLKVCPWRR